MCRWCGCRKGTITGDGPPVCRTCLYQRTALVRWPDRLTVEEVSELLAEHPGLAFVVRSGHGRWAWTWPSDNRTYLDQP